MADLNAVTQCLVNKVYQAVTKKNVTVKPGSDEWYGTIDGMAKELKLPNSSHLRDMIDQILHVGRSSAINLTKTKYGVTTKVATSAVDMISNTLSNTGCGKPAQPTPVTTSGRVVEAEPSRSDLVTGSIPSIAAGIVGPGSVTAAAASGAAIGAKQMPDPASLVSIPKGINWSALIQAQKIKDASAISLTRALTPDVLQALINLKPADVAVAQQTTPAAKKNTALLLGGAALAALLFLR